MFEDFLLNEFAKEFTGTKDQMYNAFDRWLEGLDGNDYIELGNEAMEAQNV